MSLFNTDEIAEFADGTSPDLKVDIAANLAKATSMSGALQTSINGANKACVDEIGRLEGDHSAALGGKDQRINRLTTRLQSVANVANDLYTKASSARSELNALKSTCAPPPANNT